MLDVNQEIAASDSSIGTPGCKMSESHHIIKLDNFERCLWSFLFFRHALSRLVLLLCKTTTTEQRSVELLSNSVTQAATELCHIHAMTRLSTPDKHLRHIAVETGIDVEAEKRKKKHALRTSLRRKLMEKKKTISKNWLKKKKRKSSK